MPSELFFGSARPTACSKEVATDLQSEKKNSLLLLLLLRSFAKVSTAPDVFVAQLLCIFSSAQMIITTHECMRLLLFYSKCPA